MQRLLATLLLALFGFPLIVPAIRVESDARLPACCRREGKHHCGMSDPQRSSGPAVREKCPYFSGQGAIPSFFGPMLFATARASFFDVAKFPAAHAQAETARRISFSRSRQKRGPPSLVS